MKIHTDADAHESLVTGLMYIGGGGHVDSVLYYEVVVDIDIIPVFKAWVVNGKPMTQLQNPPSSPLLVLACAIYLLSCSFSPVPVDREHLSVTSHEHVTAADSIIPPPMMMISAVNERRLD